MIDGKIQIQPFGQLHALTEVIEIFNRSMQKLKHDYKVHLLWQCNSIVST